MAAFNNGFPVTYPQMYPTYNPFQAPQPMPQPVPQHQQQSRMVEVIPVANEGAVVDFPVPVGVTQEFVAQDDSFVAFKSNGVNGQSDIVYYDRRPPAPPAPAFDPAAFVRRDEIDGMIAAAMAAQAAPKRASKKEDE